MKKKIKPKQEVEIIASCIFFEIKDRVPEKKSVAVVKRIRKMYMEYTRHEAKKRAFADDNLHAIKNIDKYEYKYRLSGGYWRYPKLNINTQLINLPEVVKITKNSKKVKSA